MSDSTQSSGFACPSCGKSVHAEPKFVGLPMECPHCLSVLTVPKQAAMPTHAAGAPARVPPPPDQELMPPENGEPSVDEQKKRRRIIVGIVILLLLLLLVLALFLGHGAGGGAGGGRGRGVNTGSGPSTGSQPDGSVPYDAGRGDQASGGPPRKSSATDSNASSKTMLYERSSPYDGVQGGTGTVGGGGTSFFGLSASGGSFVYIVDCSGSMQGKKLEIARRSLRSSIAQLDEKQEFFVFFYDAKSYPMEEEKKLVAATAVNKERCRKWANRIRGGGGTQPEVSLLEAVAMKPEVIFFMSDGQFRANICDRVKAVQGAEPIPINAIGFGKGSGEAVLKRLAMESGGVYHFVQAK